MSISCDPNSLMLQANAFQSIPVGMQYAIQTYLLAVIAGGSLDPNVLTAQANAFQDVPQITLKAIQAYLLCQITNEV